MSPVRDSLGHNINLPQLHHRFMCISLCRVINDGHIGFELPNKCNISVLITPYVSSDHKKIKLEHQNVISNMIKKKDNKEKYIYRVISAAIWKNANLGTFPKKRFGNFFLCTIHVLMISNLLKTFWSSFFEPARYEFNKDKTMKKQKKNVCENVCPDVIFVADVMWKSPHLIKLYLNIFNLF